ncbi:hypothetical protein Tco_0511372 [Tanacetum coccineum]
MVIQGLSTTNSTRECTSVTKMSIPELVEEKTNKKNDVKARSLLLMALPNEHQLTFSQYPDAKSMFAAIETRFGVIACYQENSKDTFEATYENFSMQQVQSSLDLQIHEDDLEAIDLKWQLSLLSVRAKKYYQRTGKKIFINANDIAGYDKSKVLIGVTWQKNKFQKRKVGIKGSVVRAKQTYLMHFQTQSEEIGVLKREVACKDYEINMLKSEFEKVKQEKDGIDFKIEKFDKASKDLDQLLGSQITDKSKKGLGYSAVPLPHPLIYNRPKKLDLSYSGLDEFKEPEFKGYGPENNVQESNVVCDKKSDNSKENSVESLEEEQVSQDTSSFVESSPNVDKETVFPVNKKSKPQHDDKGFVDSGCSRHMTGNIAYLSDFKEFDGGYVAFGGGAYGGRITGVDFEDVYFVNELKFNLFSVSQMCDKKNYVLFTDTECISKEVWTPRYLSLVVLLKKVGDEAVHKELGNRMERAATTASSLEAEQDSSNIKFEIISKQSNDPPLSRGYTLGSGEDGMELLELMEFCAYWCLILNAARLQLNATAKVQTVNGVRQLQALVDKKRVIITESSIRRDLHLDDAEGTDCLPTATIFKELARMGYEKPSQKLTFYKAFFSPQWKYFIHTITQCLSAKSTAWNEFSCSMASLIICLATNQKFNLSKYIFDAMVKHLDGGVKFLMYPRFLQVFINQQLGDMSTHKKIFVNPFHTKKVFANMKRAGKDFSGRITPLFDTMMVQASEEVGEDSDHPTDSTQIPIIDQPSTSSKPKKKQPSKKTQRQEAEVPQDETKHEESVPTPSNDPQPSGEDSMQLTNLMVLCTKLQTQVLDLEKAKDAQAKEIAALKKKKSRPTGLKKVKKVGMSWRVESSEDQESLGAPEDASKQGRSISDLDKDDDVTLVDETQERHDDELMFDTRVLDVDEMLVEAKVNEKDEQSTKPDDSAAGEAVTTASVEGGAAPTNIKEITLAQTLIQIKAAKPKVVTTAATTTTTTRPKARGVVVQELSEFRAPEEAQPSISKDKGKGIMIEPEVPLKRKDQIALDEQYARGIQAKLDVELIEEQKLATKQEEEANIALIESWENTQAMMEADRLLAERLQSKEREELTDEEKGKLFMELIEKRRKHFAALRAQEKRNRPPTKAQKRTQMSTYLKHMGGYTYKQLKGKSFDEIQKLFDKEMKRLNTFVAMGSEVHECKEKKVEGSEETTKGIRKKMLGRKRAGKEQQQESSKKQRMEEDKESDEVEEVEEDDEAELKKHLVIKKDEDIAIDAIPLATKLPVIIDYKLHKEGMMVHYQLIRADGSSKRYSSMIRMLQGIDREDLEALWRIVKTKYSDIRPEDEFERVLWGDLKVMFEPDKRSDVWRILQGYRVTIWKLIDSSGVHFVRFENQKGEDCWDLKDFMDSSKLLLLNAAGERITTA